MCERVRREVLRWDPNVGIGLKDPERSQFLERVRRERVERVLSALECVEDRAGEVGDLNLATGEVTASSPSLPNAVHVAGSALATPSAHCSTERPYPPGSA